MKTMKQYYWHIFFSHLNIFSYILQSYSIFYSLDNIFCFRFVLNLNYKIKMLISHYFSVRNFIDLVCFKKNVAIQAFIFYVVPTLIIFLHIKLFLFNKENTLFH
jgi:hypothetical protein